MAVVQLRENKLIRFFERMATAWRSDGGAIWMMELIIQEGFTRGEETDSGWGRLD